MTWSDGEPLTADDVALTYEPDRRRRARGGDLGLLPGRVARPSVRRDDDDGGADAEEAAREPAAAADPDRCPSTSGGRRRAGREDLQAEPEDGEPVVGLRAVPAGRRRAPSGPTYEFEANPDYWDGAPHIDRVVFRVYKSEDPTVAALKKGEIDFVDGLSALQVKALAGRARHHRAERRRPRLRRDRVQHRRRRPRDRRADRRRQPGARRTPPSATRSAAPSTATSSSRRSTRAPACPARRSCPPAYARLALGRPRTTSAFTYDPDQAAELLDEAGYTDRRRRLPDHAGRLADRHAAAVRPADSGVADVAEHDELLPGVARRPRHRRRGRPHGVEQAHERDPGRRVRRLPVGLVRRARPQLDAQLPDLRPAAELVGLVVLQRGVRRALRQQQVRGRPRRARRAWSSRCSSCSTRTRRTW